MKIAFLAICLVCAAAVSMLVFTMQTGRAPFSAPPVAPPVVTNAPTSVTVDLFSDGGSKAVNELLSALNAERELTAKKSEQLNAKEEELKLQAETITRLTAELRDAQVRLDKKIVAVDESERANFRRLADVCSKMDPASAATFLQAMDNERAATILSLVTERPAAAILDAAIAASTKGVDRAAEWADIMRRMINDKSAKTASPGM